MEDFPCVLPTTQRGLMLLEESLTRWREDHLAWVYRVIENGLEPIPPLHLGEEYTELHFPSSSENYRVLSDRTTTVSKCSSPTIDCPHIGTLLPRPLPRAFLSREHDVVHIKREVRVEPDTNSQVYYGTLGEADGDDLVLVKIYQSSMLLPGTWRDLHDMPVSDPWDNPFQQFRQEYWAYERLKALQGSLVPHVYGFFRVCLPNGEPSIALVLEANRRPDVNALDVVGCGILRALHAIQTCGIAWEDFAARNVLFNPNRPANPVLIDFALVQGVEYFHRDRPLEGLPMVLSELGFETAESKAWLKARLEEPCWATIFDLPLRTEVVNGHHILNGAGVNTYP